MLDINMVGYSMYAFLGFIGICFSIALIIGLIKPALILRNSERPTRVTVFFYWVLSIFFLLIISALIPQNESNIVQSEAEYLPLKGDTKPVMVSVKNNKDSLIKISQKIKKEMDSLSLISLNKIKPREATEHKKLQYDIVKTENFDYQEYQTKTLIKRTQYRVQLKEECSEKEINNIAREIIGTHREVDALDILFYLPNTSTYGLYTAGKATWAPDGSWAEANSNDPKKLVMEYGNLLEGNITTVFDEKDIVFPKNKSTKKSEYYIDPKKLIIGNTYSISKQTPLMPEVDPVDPDEALKKVKYLPVNGSIYIYKIESKNGIPWYKVLARKENDEVIGSGYVNSIALLGQNLKTSSKNNIAKTNTTKSSSNYQSTKPWYVGGNLHNASTSQWKNATNKNKLATAGDWLTSTIWKGHLNTPNDFKRLKTKSQMLVNAVDQVVRDTNSGMRANEIASFLITMSNDLGPY
jgi:hypothetical protein